MYIFRFENVKLKYKKFTKMATMNLRRATTKTKDKGGAGGGDRAPEKLAPDQGRLGISK